MQYTGKEQPVDESFDPKEPLSKEFLVSLARTIPRNELIMMALDDMPQDMKSMLAAQNNDFLLGFINSSQFVADTMMHFVTNPMLREQQERPRDDMDKRTANIFRTLALTNASAYYAVTLLVDRGYLEFNDDSN